MLPMALAIAAEKTAQASYAIYLYCAGGSVVVGGTAYVAAPTAWDYFYPKSVPNSENTPEDMIVSMPDEEDFHQEELRENAGLVHLNIIETNEIIASRRLAQQRALDDGIQSFQQSADQCVDATTQLNDIVQRLQQVSMNTALDTETKQSETTQLIHALTTTVDALNQSQERLVAQEKQLQQPIQNLTLNSKQLTTQLIQSNQEIKRLQSLHQLAHDAMHDKETDDLRNQINQLSMKNSELNACLLIAMQYHQPQEEPTLKHSSDSVNVGHNLPFLRR